MKSSQSVAGVRGAKNPELERPTILSVNIGAARDAGSRSRATETGIYKHAVDGAVALADPGPRSKSTPGSGVAGDFIGNRVHHGGSEQAVYAFAREELDRWSEELDRPLRNGEFGENLTTRGIDVDAAVLGEVWRIGDAELVVTGPRIPCGTFNTAMGVRGWVKRFSERGCSGAYLAVRVPGSVRAGDAIDVVSRPEHGVQVPVLFRALMGDLSVLEQLRAAAPDIPAATREKLGL